MKRTQCMIGGRAAGMSTGVAVARTVHGFSRTSRNFKLSSAATASCWNRLRRLRNGGRYELLACCKTCSSIMKVGDAMNNPDKGVYGFHHGYS